MRNDDCGQQILTENDLCSMYLRDPERKIVKALVDSNITFDDVLDLENIPNLSVYTKPGMSPKLFDEKCQSVWYMPKEYFELDIAKHILDLCQTDVELQRVGEELIMFQEREMFPLLQYLKYLVDTMRKYKIIWGVGRGSSVSSYVLYLLGVHRINSIHYDLSIDEFLK